nr:MAG TPA: hypothetical protein [Bacteriophage sp.]
MPILPAPHDLKNPPKTPVACRLFRKCQNKTDKHPSAYA